MRCVFFLFLMQGPIVFAQEQKLTDLFELSLEELGQVRVFSASRQEEPLREVPVPVTVIDSETIERLGARNLKELLITLVPGMTFSQDHNEVNVAMRGVYASSQQKFLIMVEGHRLNTRAFSEANPDFSIGLDKIKQVEVLRGPASSLYGNVALTAVVNIVLKEGASLDGGHVRLGTGNYGQRQASLLFGKEVRGWDLLIWGEHYSADGEARYIPPEKNYASTGTAGGTVILDRFEDKPSHDVGLMIKGESLSLLIEDRLGHAGEPFSAGGPTGQIYDLSEIPLFRGIGPGLLSRSTHTALRYQKQIKGVSLDARAYFDDSIIRGGLVINADVPIFASPYWHENNYGITLQASFPYQFKAGHGSVLLGFQHDQMNLISSYLSVGAGDAFFAQNPLMEPGKEHIESSYVQLKHHFNERWLFNGGLRHDHKERRDATLDNFAPRLALLYFPSPNLDLRLSYSSSFVDAPYWYRFNALPSYRGGTNLKPEFLKSWQASVAYRSSFSSLEVNAFHNDLTDFVFRDITVPLDDLDTPIYRNAGVLKSIGVETVYKYQQPQWRVQANLTWQRALEAQDYGERDGEIFNVPALSANLRLDQRIYSGKIGLCDVGLTLRYMGSQLSPIILPDYGVEHLDNRVSSALLMDANIRFDGLFGSPFDLMIGARNLMDREYEQGGSVQFPYPQPGTWYNFDVSLRF